MTSKPESGMETLMRMHENMLVGLQAAYLEWQYGKGAEAAMVWIGNILDGPGLIPDEAHLTPQQYFDAHRIPYPHEVERETKQ